MAVQLLLFIVRQEPELSLESLLFHSICVVFDEIIGWSQSPRSSSEMTKAGPFGYHGVEFKDL